MLTAPDADDDEWPDLRWMFHICVVAPVPLFAVSDDLLGGFAGFVLPLGDGGDPQDPFGGGNGGGGGHGDEWRWFLPPVWTALATPVVTMWMLPLWQRLVPREQCAGIVVVVAAVVVCAVFCGAAAPSGLEVGGAMLGLRPCGG